MNINWDKMDEKMETWFEQQAADLYEQALENSSGFLFPEDFKEKTAVVERKNLPGTDAA